MPDHGVIDLLAIEAVLQRLQDHGIAPVGGATAYGREGEAGMNDR
jgi:hypothetical protein